MYHEAQAMLIDVSPGTGSNQGLTDKLVTTIAKEEAITLDTMVKFTFLCQVILDLKQISEISRCLNAHPEIDRLFFVIEDGQFLGKAVPDGSFANDRLISIDIDSAGSRNKEELHSEIIQVIGRQDVRTLPIYRQQPA